MASMNSVAIMVGSGEVETTRNTAKYSIRPIKRVANSLWNLRWSNFRKFV
jgi:hypothetical protein